MQKRIRKAVIPAAGYGTRFLPVTKAIPKEMIPIVDKPVIQYIVEEALQSGIEEILIITGHGKRAIEDHFDTNIDLELQLRQQGKDQLLHLVQNISSINIHYIRQKHMRGLGDAIRCAESFIDNEPFAVLLGDDVVYNPEQPALKQMMDAFSRLGATMLGCQEVPQELVSRYGIVQGQPTDDDRVVKLIDMVEKPAVDEAPSRLAALGRYILTPDIFEILRRVQPGKGGEIQLTDALRLMADREAVYAYTFSGRSYDTGNKLGFLKATVEYALRRDDLGEAFREYLRHSLPE
ncbi:MAG: UTP--glucose-1-phosphate uridylyltransferase GalU [Limosilactobacillus oris]|jgi:UTP--glucose-1-phosphate uridylyltransferase|uniref:UTP--glucose-1-phosphate uridylyltransferase GalU n=1 Tax=Megasphaera sp. TaxID=2023260 RepID=UPI0025C5F403|nr:UTP--glucose-1-phosphate uridylyltransferase GalU [Megasphaera sp.]MCH3903212.1 UTP--glucose-1-phosphate uridylyltransferase GalU [Limosilactobacillus oris]MCH3931724.1 UTP--glucose-1-phosphate uridylyltransferase GalU [Megasphaera sp.]MCI1888055.1 UTP--glucose-1-phosphate uridylyltransferase GalU [Sporolactobacillus sp.]MCI1906061.1 UTP--glucose-1-phosphate uridylyltransferase GalU [Enterococcaceae bacterium]